MFAILTAANFANFNSDECFLLLGMYVISTINFNINLGNSADPICCPVPWLNQKNIRNWVWIFKFEIIRHKSISITKTKDSYKIVYLIQEKLLAYHLLFDNLLAFLRWQAQQIQFPDEKRRQRPFRDMQKATIWKIFRRLSMHSTAQKITKQQSIPQVHLLNILITR